MKINMSWQSNRKSLITFIAVLSIVVSLRVLNLGLVGGAFVGVVVGGILYFVTTKSIQ